MLREAERCDDGRGRGGASSEGRVRLCPVRSAFRSPVTSQGPPPRPRPASPEPRLAGSRPLRPAPSRHPPRLPSPGLRVGRGLCLVSGTTPGSITGCRVCHLHCDRCPPAVNVTCALSSLAGLRARRLEHSLPGLTWGSCTLRAGVCVHVCVCLSLLPSPRALWPPASLWALSSSV